MIHPDLPAGASPEQMSFAVAQKTQAFVAKTQPALIHVLDLQSASAAVIGTRGRVPVIVEPGATPAQLMRSRSEKIAPVQLKDLVRLEDRTLGKAYAVIAQNHLEAATLTKRGVDLDRVHVGVPGVTLNESFGPLPDLPALATFVTGEPERDLSLLNAALLRLKHTWRLVVFYAAHCLPSQDRYAQFDPEIRDFVEFVSFEPGWEHRLKGVKVCVAASPITRPIDAGSWCPESVYTGMNLGRPIIAPDHPTIRSHAGPAPVYFRPDDASALASAIDTVLRTPGECQDAMVRVNRQARLLDWSQSNMLLDALWSSILMGEGSI